MTTHSIISFLCGFSVMTVNIGLMVLCWHLILRKKFIALSVGVIVFKYAILGMMVYYAIHKDWVTPLAFSLGIGMVIPAALIYFVLEKRDR